MGSGLSIAASGLDAATTEIAVTSENIANAQTPDYVAERTMLAAQPGGDPLGIGDGVAVTSVAQVTNALLSANNLQAQSALSSLSAMQQVLTGIENVFPLGQSSAATATATAGSSNSSIAGQLATFWSAWDGIAQDPSASAPRTQVVYDAQGLVTSLNEAATQLNQLATNTTNELQDQVKQVNGLLGQAASLNEQIVTTIGGGGSPNQLVDQLDNVTSQLAQLAGVHVQMQANGTALVSIGGIAVVQGDQATKLQVNETTASNGITAATVTTANGGVPVTPTSGSMASLLGALGANGSIATYQATLNDVASNLAGIVDTQLAAGYTATGVSGATYPLFTANGGTTSGPVTAGDISVNPAVVSNPANIAAASAASYAAGGEANDGSNAQVMAELSTQTTVTFPSGSYQLPDVAYQQLIESIGTATQSANSQVAAQTSVANQAKQALESVTGVDTNRELTNLMQFQASYQASAKLVNVIDTTMQSLLAAV